MVPISGICKFKRYKKYIYRINKDISRHNCKTIEKNLIKVS